MTRHMLFAAFAALGVPLLSKADITYQETLTITGGAATSMMKLAGAFSKDAKKFGEPMVTTVSVKGNRMARDSADRLEIIDLDKETITNIDKTHQQYSEMTFAEMRDAMNRAAEKAKENAAKHPQQPAPSASASEPKVETQFEAHVRKTGATKQISGLDTNEIILTLTMNMKDKASSQEGNLGVTNDMWMASEIPGYAEVKDFQKRYAEKLGQIFSQSSLAPVLQQIGGSQAMKTLAQESAGLNGVPVLQVMRMGTSVNGQPLPAASEAPLPQSNPNGDNAASQAISQAAKQAAVQETSSRVSSTLGSSLNTALGGLGGFGRRKKATSPTSTSTQPASQPSTATTTSDAQSAATAGVLLESTTSTGSFSEQVNDSAFAVPAGYKLIKPAGALARHP
jgi:hypothetical protein